ncbi:MAG: molybdopterin converting factor subunit 1 [Acidobacteria bacterium]|nr:molybdopterin converting factor subunit 1 [Acidobacteriota bacterium]
MKLKVLFFGQLRDVVEKSEDALELPPGATMETLWRRYASEYPKLREMASSIAMARNQQFVEAAEPLSDGDEVAFMPPVSGGSGWIAARALPRQFYAITREPLDSRPLVSMLQGDHDGAVITFEGVTRDNTKGRKTRYLDYDCYPQMAVAKMVEIGGELLRDHPINAVGMIHRVGKLEIREASVAIVVCSAHRQAAYDASLEAINRLKKLVPIWKKEYFEDGEVWVEGGWEDGVPRAAGGSA